jgi:hypothetical protein
VGLAAGGEDVVGTPAKAFRAQHLG